MLKAEGKEGIKERWRQRERRIEGEKRKMLSHEDGKGDKVRRWRNEVEEGKKGC